MTEVRPKAPVVADRVATPSKSTTTRAPAAPTPAAAPPPADTPSKDVQRSKEAAKVARPAEEPAKPGRKADAESSDKIYSALKTARNSVDQTPARVDRAREVAGELRTSDSELKAAANDLDTMRTTQRELTSDLIGSILNSDVAEFLQPGRGQIGERIADAQREYEELLSTNRKLHDAASARYLTRDSLYGLAPEDYDMLRPASASSQGGGGASAAAASATPAAAATAAAPPSPADATRLLARATAMRERLDSLAYGSIEHHMARDEYQGIVDQARELQNERAVVLGLHPDQFYELGTLAAYTTRYD